MTDEAPSGADSTPKASARAAAISRAAESEPAPAEPEAPAGPEGDESGTEAPAKPTPIDEGTGTPSEVSEAARTLARHRSQIRKEVVEELEAEGAIEPGEVAGPGEEAEEAPAAEGEAAEGRPPTVAEKKGAEAISREFGPMSVEDPGELPDLPTGFEWVEIPSGHPLRDRGDTHFPTASGPAAEYIKSQLNNPIRNRELEAAQARARKLERQIAQEEARRRARESEEAKKLENPEIKRLVEDMQQAGYSEETISLVLQGVDAQRKDIEEQAVQQVEQVEQLKDIAHRFRSRVEHIATDRYNEWRERGELAPRLEAAYARYGDYIDAVGKMPEPAEFFRMFLDAEYASDPRVRAAMQKRMASKRESEQESRKEARQEELARLKKEIREEILAEAEERKSRRDTNPLGRLPRTQTDSRTPREDGSEGISGLTPGQVKKAARERALSRIGRE